MFCQGSFGREARHFPGVDDGISLQRLQRILEAGPVIGARPFHGGEIVVDRGLFGAIDKIVGIGDQPGHEHLGIQAVLFVLPKSDGQHAPTMVTGPGPAFTDSSPAEERRSGVILAIPLLT